MVEIRIKKDALEVIDSTKELFGWAHNSFFSFSLNLDGDESAGMYTCNRTGDFPDLVREIIAYLLEEEISFTTDRKVDELIGSLQNLDAEFEQARTNLRQKIAGAAPPSFKRKLKSYQLSGLSHLMKVGNGANFSVPGSGKTSVVYAYYEALRRKGVVDKLFVVGPFSSFFPWEDEAIKCLGRKLRSARLVGPKRYQQYLGAKRYELFLTHYQTAANDKAEIIALCLKHKILLVIDESHYIKRFSGGKWAPALLAIAPYAAKRVILSGTPMPNGYLDLWSQMTFLWPGKQLLGERNAFKSRVEDPIRVEGIRAEVRPYFYRVRKVDLKLPKPKFRRHQYSLEPIQAQIYEALAARLLSELNLQPRDRQKLRQWRKARMVRLLQAASNPTLLGKFSEEFDVPPLSSDGTTLTELIDKYSKFEVPSKFKAATELARNLLEEGRKVIIWTSFVHNIKMLKQSLKDVELYTIYGAVPRDEAADASFNREKEIASFKRPDAPSVLLANPAACAESISLHRVCHDAIYLDRTFNCGQYLQSLDRIHRIGLERNEIVNYHILLATNTIDETIDDRLEEKSERMNRVLEDDIPIGDLDVDGHEMEESDSEVERDFAATIDDLRRVSHDPEAG